MHEILIGLYHLVAVGPLPTGTFVRPIRQYNFASLEKLEQHFIKHGGEFKAENVNEYLNIGNYIIRSGYKVQYVYKGEMRTGYVSYFTNSSKGESKFGFVGTNNQGYITTIHVVSGKSFWRRLNGKGSIDKKINVVE